MLPRFMVLSLVLLQECSAKLEAAIVLPHGDFAYDPFLVDDPKEREASTVVARESRRAANLLEEFIKPDVLFLVTPHGISLSNEFGIYLGKTASGYADVGADLHRPNATYRVSLPTISLAPDLAVDLSNHMKNSNVTGIKTSADDSQDMPLQWAEVIPLLLLNTTRSRKRRRRHLIWSQPLSRLDPEAGTDLVETLLALGRTIFSWMEKRSERWAMLISADLSHTHRADGPYGYSPASNPFDESIRIWATSPCENQDALLQRATGLQPRALSCGYTGMVLLHGILCGTERPTASATTTSMWESEVFVDKNVTYYGMMAALMVRDQDGSYPAPVEQAT